MVEPVRHRQTKGAETDMFGPKATASHLDSTQMRSADRVEQCPRSKAKRKTSTRDEYFAFLTQLGHWLDQYLRPVDPISQAPPLLPAVVGMAQTLGTVTTAEVSR
jgi:hypothetical protein